MVKVPYPQLFLEVEKLYQKSFAEDQLQEIEDNIILIKELLNASGWTEEEFLERYLSNDGIAS